MNWPTVEEQYPILFSHPEVKLAVDIAIELYQNHYVGLFDIAEDALKAAGVKPLTKGKDT